MPLTRRPAIGERLTYTGERRFRHNETFTVHHFDEDQPDILWFVREGKTEPNPDTDCIIWRFWRRDSWRNQVAYYNTMLDHEPVTVTSVLTQEEK